MAFAFLWYRYMFIWSYEKEKLGNYQGKVSIIIPFYNEKPELLVHAVTSAFQCHGDKEIIVVDDGSTDIQSYLYLKKLQQQFSFQLIRYDQNMGKRYAQLVGFKIAKGDIIMTLDSDTILNKNAVVNLIKPFSDEQVGATTGQLRILNYHKNFLTRLISARYWNAFNFERQSQSSLNAIVCCSGPISAYRASLIKEIAHDYSAQTFMGKKCTYGDDRHLTTLILKKNYKIKYVKNAVAYTWAMETWKSFWKQQTRWKKSWLRETYLVSQFMFKQSSTLSFEILFNSFITFFSIFARIGLIVTLVMHPSYIFFAIFILTLMGILHSLYTLFNKPSYFIYSVLYGFVHAFFVYWTLFYAILTFKDVRWGTR
jgi:hyaluronan synthase/N-acetylglucosaminyltransferase